ncbi:uncharacterized protein PHACADRAFT_264190 [Phanerochaete carnosa HHB-10118-sp]|uniref:Thioredoxin domain-containing protein n=1 Tax=Phanerochaete carnosa (strain HHB-10118-sp) TaxID=650164 RepID=K5VHK8_PHACS|nr:uncharacterized protein PHACADRAFT_264190 [Phanerochaete carnosa HHB-10118-sp]EKM50733.1 hypothetical protein PHACADRAFT_264190 [Phanerochaete carnosa HHB-10118-sp]
MSPVTSVSKQEHFNSLVSRDKLTVVRYFAEWCGWCTVFDPIYRRIAARREFQDVTFCNVDCTESTNELEHLQERGKADGFPHVAVFRGGKLFGKKSGSSEYGAFREWLTDCVMSNAVSRSPGGKSSHSKETMHKLHEMETGGKPFIQTVSSFEEINSLASESKHILVAFYRKSKPVVSDTLWTGWEQAVSKPETEHIRMVTFDCDENEDLTDTFFLTYQSRCWFYRNGVIFSEWKSAGSRLSCDVWLRDCLAASVMADSASASDDSVSKEKGQDEDEQGPKELVKIDDQAETDAAEGSENQDIQAQDPSSEDQEEQQSESKEESEEEEKTNVTYVNSEDQWQEILSEHDQVVVTFYDYCQPYSLAELIVFESVAGSSAFESIAFCAIECNEDITETLQYRACPDIRMFRDKTQVAQVGRAFSRPDLEAWLAAPLNAPSAKPEPKEIAQTEAEALTPLEPAETRDADIEVRSSATGSAIAVADTGDAVVRQLAAVTFSQTRETSTATGTTSTFTGAHLDLVSQKTAESAVLVQATATSRELVTSPSGTLSPRSVTSDDSLFDGASPSFPNGNHSTASLTSVSTIGTDRPHSRSLPTCTGEHQDRPKPLFRWLGKRQPFHDPEPGCVFVPTEDGDGLQIGRANEGDSYFNITLSRLHGDLEKDKVTFGVGFGPDPTMKTRFVSAVFRATFGYDDDNGRRVPLKIRDLSPTDAHGEATEVHWGRGSENSLNMTLGYSSVSVGGESKHSRNAEYTRKTSARVRGQGIHTPTAEWTFQEDEGEAGRHGLDPQYQMSVMLPHVATTRLIWMEFWGKAVLARGRSLTGLDVTLKIGSIEEPYRRNMDLSTGISTQH